MKKIPYAVGNFEQIQEQGFYYVDKTFYISALEEWNTPVFLRPRRFGKSLWCSTLECYYDIKRKDKFNSLFGKTWIGQNPTQFKNAFMVLRFNFSEVSVKPDTAFIEKSFNFTQGASFDLFLHDYADYLTDYLGAVTNLPEIPLGDRLKKILSLVKARNLPPLYIIIDEYDNFTNQLITTRNDDLYKKLTTGDSFLRSFFKVIKSGIEQQSIGKVFITGVLPITIDDLTSGFNIAQMITLQKQFANMMGFTHKETKDYLSHVFQSYGFDSARMPEILEIMENHYNGYRFLPDVEHTLYHSTIVTFFLKHLVVNKDTKTIIEFKYLSSGEAGRILSLKAPENHELTQVLGYKKDALKMFPDFKITACIIYVAANKGFRFFYL